MISEKNKNPKILKKIRKGMKNVRNPHILHTLPFLHLFELFKNFGDFILFEYCLNRFITCRRWSNDLRKNQNPKILKNQQGTRILRTLPFLHLFELFKNFGDFKWLRYCFLVFLDFYFFRRSFDHLLRIMNLFKQYPSHMKSPKFLKSSIIRMGRVRRMLGFFTFFIPCLIFQCFWNLIFSEII